MPYLVYFSSLRGWYLDFIISKPFFKVYTLIANCQKTFKSFKDTNYVAKRCWYNLIRKTCFHIHSLLNLVQLLLIRLVQKEMWSCIRIYFFGNEVNSILCVFTFLSYDSSFEIKVFKYHTFSTRTSKYH